MTRPSQLCMLAGDWTGAMPPGGLMVEEKRDGFRALYFRGHDGQPGLWTRNGHPINGVDHILWRLHQLERAAGQPLFIDGEFQVDDSLAATKLWCESGWKRGGTAGTFHGFDCVPFVNWVKGGWEKPLHYRKAYLARQFDKVAADASLQWEWRPGSFGADEGATALTLIEDTWAFDAADVIDEARRVWARDGEGIMLKDAEAPYQRNRSNAWMKVKRENQHRWMRRAA